MFNSLLTLTLGLYSLREFSISAFEMSGAYLKTVSEFFENELDAGLNL